MKEAYYGDDFNCGNSMPLCNFTYIHNKVCYA